MILDQDVRKLRKSQLYSSHFKNSNQTTLDQPIRVFSDELNLHPHLHLHLHLHPEPEPHLIVNPTESNPIHTNKV